MRLYRLVALPLILLVAVFSILPATAKETLRLVYVLEASTASSFWAIDNDKVTSDLIDLQIEYVGLQAIDAAPATGQYDIMASATLTVPRAVAKGVPIKAIAITLNNSADNIGSS